MDYGDRRARGVRSAPSRRRCSARPARQQQRRRARPAGTSASPSTRRRRRVGASPTPPRPAGRPGAQRTPPPPQRLRAPARRRRRTTLWMLSALVARCSRSSYAAPGRLRHIEMMGRVQRLLQAIPTTGRSAWAPSPAPAAPRSPFASWPRAAERARVLEGSGDPASEIPRLRPAVRRAAPMRAAHCSIEPPARSSSPRRHVSAPSRRDHSRRRRAPPPPSGCWRAPTPPRAPLARARLHSRLRRRSRAPRPRLRRDPRWSICSGSRPRCSSASGTTPRGAASLPRSRRNGRAHASTTTRRHPRAADVKDRRDVFGVLTEGEPAEGGALDEGF